MRHTEFWARLEEALGPAYAGPWAKTQVIGTARQPHPAGGARRRGPAQGGLARGVAGARAPAVPAVTVPATTYDVPAIHRRAVRTLVVAQALGSIGITIGIATASLLARDVSGSESQAGLAQTTQVLGAAVASFLLARLMSRRGRRVGQVTGLLLGATGAALAVVAGVVGSMVLLLVGTALLGCSSASNLAARYAATDLAPAQSRARSLSYVVWATTVGAVVGPNLTGFSGDVSRWLGIPELDRAVPAGVGRDAGRGTRHRGLAAPRPVARGA